MKALVRYTLRLYLHPLCDILSWSIACNHRIILLFNFSSWAIRAINSIHHQQNHCLRNRLRAIVRIKNFILLSKNVLVLDIVWIALALSVGHLDLRLLHSFIIFSYSFKHNSILNLFNNQSASAFYYLSRKSTNPSNQFSWYTQDGLCPTAAC